MWNKSQPLRGIGEVVKGTTNNAKKMFFFTVFDNGCTGKLAKTRDFGKTGGVRQTKVRRLTTMNSC